MPYLRSLDGLRAVAILLVMGVHYHELLGAGWVGVQLFFVLSGFLITRILLETKPKTNLGGYLTTFFARRALRIFPLYFAFMLLLELSTRVAGVPHGWSEARPWALSYTMNFAFVLGKLEVSPVYAHLWSLAVEEQFYLVWPFVVWLLSVRALGRMALAIVVMAPLARALSVAFGESPFQLYFLTPAHMDAFAAGAVVATVDLSFVRSARKLFASMAVITLLAGGIGYLANYPREALSSFGYPYFMPFDYEYAWGYSLLNLLSASVLLCCVRGELGLLEHPWLVQLGKVSYGVYVLHRPLLVLLDEIEVRVTHLLPQATARNLLFLSAYLSLSYLLARLSYRLLESRFLALKDLFAPLSPAAPESSAEPAPEAG